MQQRLGNGFGDANGISLDYSTMPIYASVPVAIGREEKQVLRGLAQKILELSKRPCEEEKKALWYAHNALEETRPLVVCDPENGWYEIIPHTSLQCKNPIARLWEFRMRKEIFWGETMRDDKVIEDVFATHYIFAYGDFGLPQKTVAPDDPDGAYTWETPLRDYAEDLPKLKLRDVNLDYERTFQLYNLAQETFGDLLRVQLKGAFWWSLGLTWDFITLRGLETMMVDMYENPDGVHALMALLRDDALNRLDVLEEYNLLTLNNRGTYIGSGGFGWSGAMPAADFDGHVRCKDLWGFCESQETLGISPEMFAEFIFPYQKPIMERFALNCYGCCEPLDKRWHIVKDAPNLRRVSVSAWADVDAMAEMLGKNYIYSWKPAPSMLASPVIDKEYIRAYTKKAVEAAKNCRMEIIMKDNHTLGSNPQNVVDWVQIAREAAGE